MYDIINSLGLFKSSVLGVFLFTGVSAINPSVVVDAVSGLGVIGVLYLWNRETLKQNSEQALACTQNENKIREAYNKVIEDNKAEYILNLQIVREEMSNTIDILKEMLELKSVKENKLLNNNNKLINE